MDTRGFGAPTIPATLEAATGRVRGSAHSTYIDLWLALGIVGLVLHTFYPACFSCLSRRQNLSRDEKRPEFAAAAPGSVQYLVFGGLESTSLIRFSSILFFSYCLFLMVALADISKASIPIHRKRRRTRPETRSQGAFGDGWSPSPLGDVESPRFSGRYPDRKKNWPAFLTVTEN